MGCEEIVVVVDAVVVVRNINATPWILNRTPHLEATPGSSGVISVARGSATDRLWGRQES